jgi:hypothetical protein
MIMKKLLLLMLSLFMANSFAQQSRNVVFVSGTNEAMEVSINNRLINHRPLMDIRITDLSDNYYDVVIRFAGNAGKIVRGHLYIPPMSEIVYEVYAPDRRNRRGDFLIKDIYPVDNRIPYFQPDTVFSINNGVNSTVSQGNNGQTLQTGQINININNSSSANNQVGQGANQIIYVPDYAGQVGCVPPVTPERFENMMRTIEDEVFESAKLRIAKQIIKTNNCMTVNQLVQILRLFDFDENKLKLAKYAYDYVYDIENFYKVNNVFDFDSYKNKLDRYIRNRD